MGKASSTQAGKIRKRLNDLRKTLKDREAKLKVSELKSAKVASKFNNRESKLKENELKIGKCWSELKKHESFLSELISKLDKHKNKLTKFLPLHSNEKAAVEAAVQSALNHEDFPHPEPSSEDLLDDWFSGARR